MTRTRLVRRSRLLLEQALRRARYQESSDTLALVVGALVIGVLAGFGAVAFDRTVHLSTQLFGLLRLRFGSLGGPLLGVLIPAIGGALVTPIVIRWSPDVRGSGIPQVMYSVSNLGGRLPKRIVFWRPIASAISLGTGSSLGSEGPVVQLSAAMASLFSNFLRLDDDRRRTLLAVAAAGGISATFNAPIAGMFFALEAILGKYGSRNVASVVIGSVAASVVSRTFLGPEPAFAVPPYSLTNPLQLPLYFLLGIFAGFIGILVIRNMIFIENVLNRFEPPRWLRPTLGGLVVGLLGLMVPEVLGRGYNTTGAILSGEISGIGLMLVITAVKILAFNVSLASWHSGGIFAPILMIGAAFGSLFGQVTGDMWPGFGVAPGAFAVVGMAAVFAGAERAPMTTIMMIMEMSNEYSLILPLLLATVMAVLVSEVFQHESIYHVMLSRKGLSLMRLRETDLLQTITVKEVMGKEVPRLYADDSLETFAETLAGSHHHGFVVASRDDPEHVLGIVTLSDMENARREGKPFETSLREVCHKTVHCALPHEPISDVLERMARHEIGRMPVVDPKDRRRAVGFVRQSDLARAYYQALQRHRQVEEQEEARRLRDLTGQEIIEVKVRAGCALVGKTLREAKLPQESIIVGIRRGGKTVFPHGDTTIEAGDTVVANVAPGFGPSFRTFFAA